MEASIIATIGVALITAVIGPSILELVKNKLSRKKEKDPMYDEMVLDVQVEEQLKSLLDTIGCDRIWVTQFHNGGHYYSSGASIKKFSVFYEVVSSGTSLIQQSFQNVPTSFFSRSLKEIADKNSIEVYDMNDTRITTYGLRDSALETGCQSLFMTCLKTPSGKLHGAMGIEFVKDKHKFTIAEKSAIKNAALYVSGILSTIHNAK
jgi:hypothetical protein